MTNPNTPDQPSMFNRFRHGLETRTGKAVTIATIFAMGLVGLDACSSSNAAGATHQTPVPAAETATPHSQSGTRNTEATPSQDPESTPGSTTEQEADPYKAVQLQTKTLEQMQAMTPDDFAQLSIANRIAFGYDIIGSEAFPTDQLGSDPVANEAKDIPGFYWQPTAGDALNNPNPDTREKLATVYSYYATNPDGTVLPGTQDGMNSAEENGGAGTSWNGTFVYQSSGSLQKGVDRDGNKIEFRNVTYAEGFQSNASYRGPVKTTQAVYVAVKLLSGKTIVFPAMGYTTAGQASPDRNYPY